MTIFSNKTLRHSRLRVEKAYLGVQVARTLKLPTHRAEKQLTKRARKERAFGLWTSLLRSHYFFTDRLPKLADAPWALLINDTSYEENVGCYATSQSLKRAFRNPCGNLQHTLTLQELNALAYALWILSGRRPTLTNVNRIVDTFAQHAAFTQHRKIIASADKVFINGEGSLYGAKDKGLILLLLAIFSGKYCKNR